jgi:hypothetical protein
VRTANKPHMLALGGNFGGLTTARFICQHCREVVMNRSLIGILPTTLPPVFPETVLLAGLGGIIDFWIARIEPSRRLAEPLWGGGVFLALLVLLVMAFLAPRQRRDYRARLDERSRGKAAKR